MTAFFGVLIALGAAGLAASLYGKGRTPSAAGFAAALDAAETAVPGDESRLEAVEARLAELEALVRSLAAAERARRAPRAAAPARGEKPVTDRSRTVWNAYRGSGDPLVTARALNRGMAEVELALKMNRLRGRENDENI